MIVPVKLVAQRDQRTIAYVVVVVAMLAIALLAGRVELVAFAAPFALVLTLGHRQGPRTVSVDMNLDTSRLVEGDLVTGTATLLAGDIAGRTVDVLVRSSPDLPAVEPASRALGWQWTEPGGVDFELRATRWGHFHLGPVHARVRDPLGITYWEGTATVVPDLLVLPAAPRLDRLLEPRSSRATAGFHLDRRGLGAGLEFAELHNYQPGDRLRNLNRAATARTGVPIVNRHHPERSGEVVILLDAFIDSGWELSDAARQALVTAARATWAITRAHLTAQDRVGVASVGRIPVWLPPAAGAKARYTILEALLSVGAVLEGKIYGSEPVNAGRIPPAALVVFVSPLWDDRYLPPVQRLQARGRETAVLQLATADLLPPPTSDAEALARRLFELGVADRADALRGSGIPVVAWSPESSLSASINAAARLQVRRRTARAQ